MNATRTLVHPIAWTRTTRHHHPHAPAGAGHQEAAPRGEQMPSLEYQRTATPPFCPRCGAQASPTHWFCVRCGAALARRRVPMARRAAGRNDLALVGPLEEAGRPHPQRRYELCAGDEVLAAFCWEPAPLRGAWPPVSAVCAEGAWTFIHRAPALPLTTVAQAHGTDTVCAAFTAGVGGGDLALVDGRRFRWRTRPAERYGGELWTTDGRLLLHLALTDRWASIQASEELLPSDQALLMLFGVYLLLIRRWADHYRPRPGGRHTGEVNGGQMHGT